ncbi:threonine/serine exporter family protein [Cetobacterium sp. 2A]|uniref:threonine/serine exporter family protein n=1 Tax=Cetobacterium sp. 2A TaxID=2754723 RepID=UPI00163B80EC|nr:threonine/serine exporter family protein [Cetobacterium sp. 2A]MBC2855709.1 threonine/serine exporter family protein [Cetobacterium sp. 2A]
MLKNFIQVVASILATYGFGIVFNVKGRVNICASLCGGIGWLVYSILNHYNFTYLISYTIASATITIYSELLSRKLKVPVIALLFPSMIPLVPGGGIYFTMYNLVQNNIEGAVGKGIETFIISGSIAIGILSVSTFSQVYYYLVKKKSYQNL